MKTKLFLFALFFLLLSEVNTVKAQSIEKMNSSSYSSQLYGSWFYRFNGITYYEQLSKDNTIINDVLVTVQFNTPYPQNLSYKLKTFGAKVENFEPVYGRLEFIANSNPSDAITFEFTYIESGQAKSVEYNFWIDPASMGGK